MMTHWEKKALEFVSYWHGDQKRKYTGEPYVNHLKNVYTILREDGGVSVVQAIGQDLASDWSEDVYIASILHDTIEDTDATRDMVTNAFGHSVASLVMEVTDISVPEDGNRAFRKKLDLRHLTRASRPALIIKLADTIDNMRDIEANDPDFAEVYRREKKEFLEAIAPRVGETDLFRQARGIVERLHL